MRHLIRTAFVVSKGSCTLAKFVGEDVSDIVMLCRLPHFPWPPWVSPIDIKSLQNRLLKLCNVPATGAVFQSFFFLFYAVVINSTNEANKAGNTHL